MDSNSGIANTLAMIDDEVKSLVKLAETRSDSNVAEAEQTLRRALDLSESNLGRYHYRTRCTLAALGHFYRTHGSLTAAEAIYQQLLSDCERACGRLDRRTLFAVERLGDIYLTVDKLDECEAMYCRAFQGYEKLDSEGETALRTKNSLAVVVAYRGRHLEAENLYLQVLHGYKDTVGLANGAAISAIQGLRGLFIEQAYGIRQGAHERSGRDSDRETQVICLLIRLLTITQELKLPAPESLETIAKICFWAADHDNCRKAFRWWRQLHSVHGIMDSGTASTIICDLCNKKIFDLPRYFCMTCQDVDICGKCFATRQNREGPPAMVLGGCAAHSFFEVENDEGSGVTLDPDQLGAEVREWLRDLLHSKQAAVAAIHSEDDWDDGSVSNPVPPSFDMPDWEIPRARLERLSGTLQEFRVFEVRQRIPAMLRYAFTLDGFEPNSLPAWPTTSRPSEEEIMEALTDTVSKLISHGTSATSKLPKSSTVEQVTNAENARNAGNLTAYSLPQDSVYTAKGLNPNEAEIRVLDLLPGSRGSPIRCKLRTVNISQRPQYHAVSYVWGAKAVNEPCHTVEVDGKMLEVTANLHIALSDLRENESPRTLWVDAICINQKDEGEKGAQVAMMGDIYRHATEVAVHLGQPDESLANIFDFFNRTRSPESLDESLGRMNLEKWPLLKSFVAFCSKPWWTRIWVHQEYASASEVPVFYNDRRSTKATHIVEDMRQLFDEVSRLLLTFEEPLAYEYFGHEIFQSTAATISHSMGILNLRHSESRGVGCPRMLRSVFKIDTRSRCTVPLDIIYGRRAFLEPVVQTIFPPDYTISCHVLFEKLAFWLLVFDGWSELFWYFPHRLSEDLPSWVPDFNRRRTETQVDKALDDSTEYSSRSPAVYNGVLALHGHFIDVVGPVFQPEDESSFQQSCNLWHLDNFLDHISRKISIQNPFPLSRVLPLLYSSHGLLEWSFREDMATRNRGDCITSYLEQLSLPEYNDMVSEVFEPIQEKLQRFRVSLYKMASSAVLAAENTLVPPENPNLVLTPEWRSRIDHPTRMNLASAATAIQCRVISLHTFLTGDPSPADFLGAALFDYENLVSQVKDLKLPRRYDNWDISVETGMRELLEEIQQEFALDSAQLKGHSRRPMDPSLASYKVHYEDLQRSIVDCNSDEEVQFRVRLVLKAASMINQSVTSDGKRKIPKPYPQGNVDRIAKITSQIQEYIQSTEQLLAHKSSSPSNQPRQQQHDGKLTNDPTGFSDSPSIDTAALERKLEDLKGTLGTIGNDKILRYDNLTLGKLAPEFEKATKDRTFFHTKNGLVGVGTRGVTDIRPGDQLIMLSDGVKAPLVIRPIPTDPNYYELVGYSLVHGLMDGKFHSLEEYDKPDRRIFKLK